MRDRAFIVAVACVGILAVLMLVQNVRESTAPLYGPPTVDRKIVMTKVEQGALSFKEARFYVREGDDRDNAAAEEAKSENIGGDDHQDKNREPGEDSRDDESQYKSKSAGER